MIIYNYNRNYQHYCVFIQLNIGYIGIVLNEQSVEILKSKYSLGDIINFKVVELDQSKKRYVLDINEKEDDDKENCKLITKLNVCEKSFYPQSYLKKVNNNEINDKKEYDRKEISIYE